MHIAIKGELYGNGMGTMIMLHGGKNQKSFIVTVRHINI